MNRLFCLLLFLLCCPNALQASGGTPQPEQGSIDFLYINGNIGEAAGGHSALRLGQEVFHYQLFPDATFLLVRESWDSFRFVYNELRNRSIRTASLALSLTGADQIREHFTELLAEQRQFLDDRERLRQERALFEGLLDTGGEVSVPGLGYFEREGGPASTAPLREVLETTLGSEVLAQNLLRAEEDLAKAVSALNLGELSATSFMESVTLTVALRILVEGWSLRGDALIPVLAGERELSPAEWATMEILADSLAQDLAKLLGSSRPDRGQALLLATARYLAIGRSLQTGELLSLDPFVPGGRQVLLSVKEQVDGLAGLKQGLTEEVLRRRHLFLETAAFSEISCTLLETGRALAWELQGVASDHPKRVRLLGRLTLPERPASLRLAGLGAERRSLLERLSELGAALERQRQGAVDRYGYRLLNKNCVTELMGALKGSFEDSAQGKALLGGWLEGGSLFGGIPFVWYGEVAEAFSLRDEQLFMGRRLRKLDLLYAQDNDLLVWFQESNTLSSTLYQWREQDTPFLFFTDDLMGLRPLLGTFNVLSSGLYGLVGLLSLPLDGGTRLGQALEGLLYSLPELLFINLRKGSYGEAGAPYVPVTVLGNDGTLR